MSGFDLNSAMRALTGGGLERLSEEFEAFQKEAEEAAAENTRERQKMAQAIAAFAATDGGALFLDRLVRRTIYAARWPIGADMSAAQKQEIAIATEARAALVVEILKLIHEGRGNDAPPPERSVVL